MKHVHAPFLLKRMLIAYHAWREQADAGLTFCGNHENMASQQSALYSQSHPGKQDMSAVTKVMMAH